MLTERQRAYTYRVFLAIMPLLTAYGAVTEQTAPLFVALAGTVLGFGLAAANTSTDKD